MSSSEIQNKPLIGITVMLLSVLLFSIMDAVVKGLGGEYPTHQVMFFRCSVALIPVLIFLRRVGGLSILKTERPFIHILRSLFGLSAMSCAFYGFSIMPLAEASAVFYTAPLLGVIFSVFILREKIGIRRWSAVSIGLIGTFIVIRPGYGELGEGALFMFVAAIFVGLTTNIVRLLSATDHPACITFYFTISGTLISLILCLVLGWSTPSPQDLISLISIGLLGGCAQYSMSLAYGYSQIGLVAPLKYISIVTGSIIGYFVWSEIPDTLTIIGMVIIMASGIYTIKRETALAKAQPVLHRD